MIKKTLAGILIFYIGFVYAQDINRSAIPFEPEQVISQIYQDDNWNQRQSSFLVDTVVTSLPGIGEQREPAVAFDGTNYFIVYTEYRHGTPRIYGMRVTQDGILLDSSGICISFNSESQYNPAVVFDGTNYFVVWQDYRNYGADIYGARVSTSGQVFDPDGILIDTTSGQQRNPTLAFDGTNFLVVWCWESDIYGTRVSQTGQVLDTNPIPISTANDLQRAPSIAFDGNNFLVVWEDSRNHWWLPENRDIYGARVSTSGIVLDTAGIEICVNDSCRYCFPTVAFDGTHYFVVWQDYRNYEADIYGARVSINGQVLDPNGIPIVTASWPQSSPTLAFDGTNYFVTWQDLRNGLDNFDIYGARISTSGNVIDTMGIAISTANSFQCYPVIDFDGVNYLVVWQDKRFGSTLKNNICCARVNQSGQVLDPGGIDLSIQMPTRQSCPAVAFDGTNYFIVWHDFHNESFPEVNADIYGIRVDELGQVLDSSAIAISTAAHDQLFPAVAFDGTNYFVVWEDHGTNPYYPHIYGARVSQTGIVLDTAGIGIATDGYDKISPSIAFDGTNYLAVWVAYHGVIYGTRVSQTGVVLDSGGFVIDPTGWYWNDNQTSIAYGADAYLVVWNKDDIYGARVCTSGVVIDTMPIQISNGQYREFSPSVIFDGTNFFVVWADTRHRTNPHPLDSIDIYGARLRQSGIVLDTANIRISQASGYQACPSVEFDGDDYLVVWEDSRSDSSYDIYGAKINSSGAIINTYQIAVQPGHQFEPRLAHGNNDQILIAYSGWTDSINAHPAHVMRIWGTFYPFIGIQENDQSGIVLQLDLSIFPNPFRRRAEINFSLGNTISGEQCSIEIFDITGRLMRIFSINQCNQDKSVKSVYWDGTDNRGQNLSAGVYFCRLSTDLHIMSQKIIFLK